MKKSDFVETEYTIIKCTKCGELIIDLSYEYKDIILCPSCYEEKEN